jgi:hypothetical protein
MRFQSPVDPRTNNVEPFTQLDLTDMDESSLAKVSDMRGETEIKVDAESLLAYLDRCQSEGKAIWDVSISAYEENGDILEVKLDEPEIWFRCLCRRNNGIASILHCACRLTQGHVESKHFRAVLALAIAQSEIYLDHLEDFRKTPAFKSLLFFVTDLVKLSNGGSAQDRMDAAGIHDQQVLYLSPVHFGEDLETILSLPSPNGSSLLQILRRTEENTAQMGIICSAHDVLPVLQRFFHLPHQFWKDPGAKKEYKKFNKNWKSVRKGNM